MSQLKEIASGLEFPEGPVVLPDGSVLVVEIKGHRLTRIALDGRKEVVATIAGGPNGAALGPDGKIYVCNNGNSFNFVEHDGLTVPTVVSADYIGGSIDRVDLATGAVETLYTHAGAIRLIAPNDLVFDDHGGFWFTDHGRARERDRDRTAIYYAKADGSAIVEAAFPLDGPNGIGLSPDGRTVYVAETYTGRVWKFAVGAPGTIDPVFSLYPNNGGELLGAPGGVSLFDSLAVDGEGWVCVATLLNGGITAFSPDGKHVEFTPTGDPLTTNICFGGNDLRTAYVTLSGTGKLAAMEWRRPGLRLPYQA